MTSTDHFYPYPVPLHPEERSASKCSFHIFHMSSGSECKKSYNPVRRQANGKTELNSFEIDMRMSNRHTEDITACESLYTGLCSKHIPFVGFLISRQDRWLFSKFKSMHVTFLPSIPRIKQNMWKKPSRRPHTVTKMTKSGRLTTSNVGRVVTGKLFTRTL